MIYPFLHLAVYDSYYTLCLTIPIYQSLVIGEILMTGMGPCVRAVV